MKLMPILIALVLAGFCLSYSPTPDTHPDNDPDYSMVVDVASACGGNAVSVMGKGENVSGAHVSVKDVPTAFLVASGETNAGGVFVFEGCGRKVDVKVTSPDFSSEIVTLELIDCEACVPAEGCINDSQCPDNMACGNGECGTVGCACGVVANHQCEAYACCGDSACSPVQACTDHECKDIGGGCGVVTNHTFIAYECGTEGCPACQEGYGCIGHRCILGNVTCPEEGIVGNAETCSATENGEPCANCDYVVTDPFGKNSTGMTDGNGSFSLPLDSPGTYQVSLLKDGLVMRAIEIKSMPGAGEEGEDEKPTAASTDFLPILGGLLLVLLLALAVFFWRSRAAKK